ncbi:MAG: response regulator transcription factor [Lentimicrobiaceae bacterium]|jgi:DNA-binding NarL/FixJ family response regulator|nr:response regulator transcription factor [Lentimicrobiaceae bacterium]MDD4597378.1 response regulator transcription factor [Lentimicrobiaceae bacterium]MDY0026252.1 response regulator transcription factor [Lentimicrobium sp.]
MSQEKIIKVLVVDDHQLIIDGLKSLLQDEPDIVFAGGANSMQEAIDFVSNNPVQVVLADISMPEGSGIETTRSLKEIQPDIQILALTMHEDINMIRKMVEAGASGYILKRTNMNEVLEAIRIVAKGEKYLGRDVQEILLNNMSQSATPSELTVGQSVLTQREKEILILIANEMQNDEIAEKLFISERTVETHRRNMFTKTKTKSIVGLIKYAIANGLIDENPG